MDIFVSYSTQDKVVADAVVSTLEKDNMRCWYAPRDIEPGADWGESITDAIHDCRIFLLIFSTASNQSKRVLDEVYYAISEEKTIIPFRIEKLDPTGAMRLHLSSRHWLDAYDPSWNSHLNHLSNSLKINLGRETSQGVEIERSTPLPRPAEADTGKKPPWLWISLAAALVIILTTAGILWNTRRTHQADASPTSSISELGSPGTTTDGTMDAASTSEVMIPATQSGENAKETAEVVEEQEVVLDGYLELSEFTLDPQIWLNGPSVTIHENLFLNLVNYDIEKKDIVPEAASSWTVSPDGKTYTFKLRTDIPWVMHTPGGETVQVVDENGDLRFVNAQDFVYGFQRLCDPRVDSSGLTNNFLGLLKGCQEVYQYEDLDSLPQDLIEGIGVRAIGTDELLIELEKPSGYFLSMSSMTFCAAVPQWAIEKYGNAWMNPGLSR